MRAWRLDNQQVLCLHFWNPDEVDESFKLFSVKGSVAFCRRRLLHQDLCLLLCVFHAESFQLFDLCFMIT